MTWLSLGSMALPFQLGNQGVRMRTDIARLGEELTTGLARDPSRHLRGETGQLAAIAADLAKNDAFLQNLHPASLRAETAQNALSVIENTGAALSRDLLTASAQSTPGKTLSSIGHAAQAALADTVSALSVRSGGAALFSGVASDGVPLVSADEMLDDLRPLVAGLSSATDIADTISAEFLDPGGLFESRFYRGGAPADGPLIGPGETLAALPTADNRAIRQMLAGFAIAAMIAEPPGVLPEAGLRILADRTASMLMASAGGIADLQSETGRLQAMMETRQTRLLAEKEALAGAKLALVAVDPYETATRLQDTETRLNALYVITARTARLSLTEYLR